MRKGIIYTTDIQTSVGALRIGVYNDAVCMIDWVYRKMRKAIDARIEKLLAAEWQEQMHPLHELVEHQLEEYLSGKRNTFDFPIIMVGSDFQQSVWEALQQVSYGTTKTYLELANQLGDPKAVRAVASANGANALSIVIPCHRIIGKNGDLVGYAGGLPIKKKLLMLEGALQAGQLSLF